MRKYILILLSLGLLPGCQPGFKPSLLQYSGYNIQRIAADSSVSAMLRPYATEVSRKMLDTVGNASVLMRKELPDGALGNFLADSYLTMARRKFDPSVQMAFLNNGGIRINQIPAGPILRGTIYEVMPFDNEMVILKVTGAQLQAYLDFVSAEGGGGIAGVKMTISGKKATDVRVDGKPIDQAATYVMANSDYTVFSGGFGGLKTLPVRRTGYLLRDATIDYCLDFRQRGLPIVVDTEKRIRNVQ
jgi:2',3'-cyclic-nucleotide 2'-phosphodiesterase (5'-nucleotidase family)